MLGLNNDNSELIDFICYEKGEEIMQENSFSIHVEIGNIFCDNFNTNESFYDFLLAQQDEDKQIIKKRISYFHIFTNICSDSYKVLILKKLINTIYTQTKMQNFYFIG